ncbi:MAG TPA: toll/interleukin-1 receptor domain-containing protein [Bryobacteraceae bacterium]|nr:toll/interleukin-1 receptor domain-containing protein [Bryobacteraceae bacterium]
MSKSKFPVGWNEERIRKVLAHYEGQTEDNAVLEDEAGVERSKTTVKQSQAATSRVQSCRIFISHSSNDKAFALLVAEALRKADFDPWIDSAEVLVGDDIIESVGEGLKTMDLLLFLVSHDALKSPWVDRELKSALMRAVKEKEIRVLPFVIDDTPLDDLPWHVKLLHARRVTADLTGSRDICRRVREIINRRLRHASPLGAEFKGDRRLDALVKPVKLGDWHAAEEAALEIIKTTDSSGQNELFEVLLNYQDLNDEDPRLWGALHTIECCVRLAPWLISHRMISRMANHPSFSVRSSAASICLDLAHSAPDRVPFDVVAKLSSYDEDWYVETPANSAIKAMAGSFPSVLRVFFQRLRSKSSEEREHALDAIRDIAVEEPEILAVEDLQDAIQYLSSIGDKDNCDRLVEVLSKVKTVRHKPLYRYGF